VYKRWWFWTLLGVAAAGGVTAAVLLGRKDSSSPCDPGVTCGSWGP
jgi:hypothetical protein